MWSFKKDIQPAWWQMPIIPDTGEVKAVRPQIQDQPGQLNKILSQNFFLKSKEVGMQLSCRGLAHHLPGPEFNSQYHQKNKQTNKPERTERHTQIWLLIEHTQIRLLIKVQEVVIFFRKQAISLREQSFQDMAVQKSFSTTHSLEYQAIIFDPGYIIRKKERKKTSHLNGKSIYLKEVLKKKKVKMG